MNDRHKRDCMDRKPAETVVQPCIKMVRYRLDVGGKHQITSEELKKVLIEESGVDKNNIYNINIQSDYTLVELPDEMPQDIFLHLKTVEIKQHKLDIKRVKTRNKKRGNNRRRRGKQRKIQSSNPGANQTDSRP
ncbi:MAG: DbpA RNA binding domain-containing protein [Methylobacter sp.]